MLNTEQKELTTKLEQHIKNKKGIFLVLGAGGVGKTYTICQMNYDFVFLAPTHKAKSVLALGLKEKGLKNPECLTIARFLGFDKYKDENDNDIKIYKGVDPNIIKNNRPIIVDEVSMISNKELELLHEVSKENPIIFLGDWLQIPPVSNKQEIKKLFNYKGFYLSQSFNPKYRTEKYVLTIQNRQNKESSIFNLINYFRKEMQNKINYQSLLKSVNQDDILSFDLYSDDFKKFVKNNNCVGISYTNITADYLNYFLGKIYAGVDKYYLKDIYDNETVMFRDYYFDGFKRAYTQTPLEIKNRENKVQEIYFENDLIYKGVFEFIDCFRMEKPEANEALNNYCKNKRRSYSNLKPTEKKKKLIEINNFADKTRNSFAKIMKANGITSHKSQGSTYENIIIPLNDFIYWGENYKQMNQILYVALSRAKKRIIFIENYKNNWKKPVDLWHQSFKDFYASKNNWEKNNGEKISKDFTLIKNKTQITII
jgi:hypothetical protein